MKLRKATQDSSEIKKESQFSARGATLKILAGTGITAGIILHFIGNVSHEVYLKHWGIAAGQFPKSADWVSTNGYYTLFAQIIYFFTYLKTNWLNVLEFWITIVLAVAYILLLQYVNKKIDSNKSFEKWLQRRTNFTRLTIQVFFLGTLFSVLMICGVFLAISIMALPALVGNSQGKYQAESDQRKFQMGCDKGRQAMECIEIRKDGNVVVKGFIIDSSESRIAVYDVAAQRARVLELQGYEIISNKNDLGN